MNPFSKFPTDHAKVEKADGSLLGPHKMIFTGKAIIVCDVNADIEEGDCILRELPNGIIQRHTVTESNFYQKMQSIPAHFQVKATKGAVQEKKVPRQTINIHSAGAVQIGDHNTQQITATIQALVQKIESSDASAEDKSEVKSLLQKFLAHPLVAAAVGAAISLG